MSSIKEVRVNIGDPKFEVVNGKQVLVGTYKIKYVDKSKFVKVFPEFTKMLLDCSKPSIKIICYVIDLVQEAKFGHDVYCFNYLDVGMGKVNFYSGIRELLEYRFLYKTHIPSQYKINTKMILNGKGKKEDATD